MRFLLAFLLFSSCGGGQAILPVPPAITTDATRYVFHDGTYGPEITIRATFTAPKDRTVYLVNCNGAISTGLQQRVGNKWVNAWDPETDACLSAPIVLAPGAQHEDTIVARRSAEIVIYGPDARKRIWPGTYRVVWHNVLTSFDANARPFGPDLPLEQRVSAPIAID